jgi:hypothetical protein
MKTEETNNTYYWIVALLSIAIGFIVVNVIYQM